MTVGALSPSKSYLENGVTTVFAVPFRYLAADDLVVSRVTAGVESLLTYGVDWSATDGPTDAGGTLTLGASVSGATLKIRRSTPRQQQTDYTTGDAFPADSHEQALDRLTLIAQELGVSQDDLDGRALLVPAGETIGDLPAVAVRMNKGLGFDAAGAPVAIEVPATAQAAAEAAAVAALAAQIATEAARDAALAAYDQFDDRYLGSKTANPVVDNDGNALISGALYFNSIAGEMRLWTGSAWVAAYVSGTGLVSKTGDTMTGLLVTLASAAANAGLRLPHGAAPTAPIDGDFWSTTVGFFARVAGVSRQFAMVSGAQSLSSKTLVAPIMTGLIQLNGSMQSVTVAMGALDIDCSQGNYFSKTINANSTFTFSNAPAAGSDFLFLLTLTHTSGTVTWPGSVSWPNSTAPVLTAGKKHRFIFHTNDGGSTWGGAAQPNY